MNKIHAFRGLASMVLAAAFFFFAIFPAGAAELPEETSQPTETTLPSQSTEIPETTQPPGTTQATQPPETTEATQPPETTEATQPEETTAATEAPATTEETLPEEESAFWSARPVITEIAQVWELPRGTENILIQGTVVFAYGTQAVLEDTSGGIRLSFTENPQAELGDVLLVTGMRIGGFTVTSFERQGSADLPATETTLMEAPENIRIRVKNAVLGNGNLTQEGFSIAMTASLPDTVTLGDTVDAWGVIMDGHFYADTIVRQEQQEEESTAPWNLYFGQLHAHSDISSGTAAVEDVFAHAAQTENMDFFAVTDHSHSFDNALFGAIGTEGSTVSTRWEEGKAAAAAVTGENFVGIYGYEMAWSEDMALGHISTFRTPGWQARQQPGFETLEAYYEALTTVPSSISQFNHPSRAYGDFVSFSHYRPEYDAVIQLLEVGGENGLTAYDYYTMALDRGWHVAPSNNQTPHDGSWTDTGARTVVLAQTLTERSLYDAIADYRVYATEDRDLEIIYQLNGQLMGSILGPADSFSVTAELWDPTDTVIGTVEVIADGGECVASQTVGEPSASVSMAVPSGHGYYYLRITQPDGDVAVTAPVWVDSYENVGIQSFTADTDQPMERQEVRLTLELYNQESTEFVIDRITFSQNGTVFYEVTSPGTVNPSGALSHTVPYTWTQAGQITVAVAVTGTIAGQSRTCEDDLTLHCQSAELTESTIAGARDGTLGETYRVTGYVTAGNSNPYTTFPNTLYLQDDTGGIAVVGLAPEDIQIGMPMEVTGCLRNAGGNLILELIDCSFPGGDFYRYTPRTMTHAVAMNYDTHGGELLQIEGEVVSLIKTADGSGISRFTIKDVVGELATVIIEENIGSGAYADNTLATQVKKGRTVRIMGLLHVDEYGTTVLRVRNCDEVIYVPPKADPTNPKTGDIFFLWK